MKMIEILIMNELFVERSEIGTCHYKNNNK